MSIENRPRLIVAGNWIELIQEESLNNKEGKSIRVYLISDRDGEKLLEWIAGIQSNSRHKISSTENSFKYHANNRANMIFEKRQDADAYSLMVDGDISLFELLTIEE